MGDEITVAILPACEQLRSVWIQTTQIIEVAEFRSSFAWDSVQDAQKVVERWKAQAIRDYEQLPDDAQELDPHELVREVNRRAFSHLKLTLNIVNSSSLVLVHSLVDALVNDLLNITAIVARPFWEASHQDRSVKLRDVHSAQNLDDLRRAIVTKSLDEFARTKSLADRVDRIHTICSPKESGCSGERYSLNCVEGFTYERAKLEEIDRARQNIIHHKGVTDDLPNIQEQIVFLGLMMQNLCVLMGRSYGLQVNLCAREMESRIAPFRLKASFQFNEGGDLTRFHLGE